MAGVRKACRSLGITLHDEGAPVGEHQSNGAAESTVLQIRSRAGLLVQQIEDQVAAGRIIFGCNHPVYCWALLHASWFHNHFTVSEGLTPFERGMDRSYTGKLAMYGEEFLGYLRTGLKAGPRWSVAWKNNVRRSAHCRHVRWSVHYKEHQAYTKSIQLG